MINDFKKFDKSSKNIISVYNNMPLKIYKLTFKGGLKKGKINKSARRRLIKEIKSKGYTDSVKFSLKFNKMIYSEKSNRLLKFGGTYLTTKGKIRKKYRNKFSLNNYVLASIKKITVIGEFQTKCYNYDKNGIMYLAQTLDWVRKATINENELESWVNQQTDNPEEPETNFAETQASSTKITVNNQIVPQPINISPVKETSYINIDGFVDGKIWCKDRDMCFVDWVQYKYKNTKGFKKNLTDDLIELNSTTNLKQFFKHKQILKYLETNTIKNAIKNDTEYCEVFCNEYKSYLEKTHNKYNEDEIKNKWYSPNKYGYTLEHIKTWCKNMKVNLYCLSDGVLVYRNHFKTRNDKGACLIFELKNNHFNPITELKKIKSIVKRGTKTKFKSNSQIEKETVNTKYDIEYLNSNIKFGKSNLQYALEVMSVNNKITYPNKNLVLTNKNLNSFILDNKKYLLIGSGDEDIDYLKSYCNQLNIKYQGQSPAEFTGHFMKDFKDKYSSYYNQEVQEALSHKNIKWRTHLGTTVDNKTLNELWDSGVAYDINKCYRSIMEDPLEDFMTIQFNSMIEETNKYKGLGLYYIKTNDNSLFHYSNWYSSAMLQFAKAEKIKFDIKYYIKGNPEGKTILKNIIDTINSNVNNTKLAKLMINCIYGYLMKTKSSKTYLSVDKDINRAWDSTLKHKARTQQDVFIYPHKCENGQKLYAYGNTVETEFLNHNVPMGIQILDQSNIKLYKISKYGKLLYRKTDCAVIVPNRNVPISDKIGELKIIPSPCFDYLKQSPTRLEREVIYELKREKWNTLTYNDSNDFNKIIPTFIRKGGGLLCGRAGTGKTFTANKGLLISKLLCDIRKEKLLNKNLAFTNKATINLNGSTIHSFLSLTENGKLNKSWANKQHYNLYIIDEISMISAELWQVLTELKKATGAIFILIGDYRQLPAIENNEYNIIHNYFDHPNIKYLCNNNSCELTSMKRYELDLWNFLEDIYTKKYSNKTKKILNKRYKINPLNGFNMCYLNNTRKYINKFCNEYYSQLNTNKHFIEYTGKPNKYNQDSYIYKDCRLIMNITPKDKTLKKNEAVRVINFDIKKDYINVTNGIIVKQFKLKEFHKVFLLNYCTTIHKCQGDTIDGTINLFDIDFIISKIQDERVLYTAFSRSTKLSNIKISM